MIDFAKDSIIKLSPIALSDVDAKVAQMLVAGEEVVAAFKGIRDSAVFTNKRVISIDVQGITGKKIEYTSLPFSKVQAFSVETAGSFDFDCELDLFFSGLGKIRFEIKGNFDILKINTLISNYIL
jgi:Bacterial PH domain